MRTLLVLTVFVTLPAYGSKCSAPIEDRWYPTLRAEVDHYRFQASWDEAEPKKVTFRDKNGREVMVLSPSGVTVNGKPYCSLEGGELTNCPPDLPLKTIDEVFFGEIHGIKNGKLEVKFRGQPHEVTLPKGMACEIVGAETTQKKLVEQELKKPGLVSFLDGAVKCLTGRQRKCRSQLIPKTYDRQLTPGAEALLVSLLKHRTYPHAALGVEQMPEGPCTRQKPSPNQTLLHGMGCDRVELSLENGQWKITNLVDIEG